MSGVEHCLAVAEPPLDVIENFPGFDNSRRFLREAILTTNSRVVADIGGGANPLISEDFIVQHGLDFSLLDISSAELYKAPEYYRKLQVDMTAPPAEFRAAVGEERFDLIFTHMFLEHVRDPLVVHKNIYMALKPGGVAIHFYPTPNNVPLAINRFLSDRVTSTIVRVLHPKRNLDGRKSKFPAFYAMCGSPSKRLHAIFHGLGYAVVRHTAYIGHDYYLPIPGLRDLERIMRPVLCRAGIPMTADAILILQKPPAANADEPAA